MQKALLRTRRWLRMKMIEVIIRAMADVRAPAWSEFPRR